MAQAEKLFPENVSEEEAKEQEQELNEDELENVSGGGPSGRHR